MARCEDFPCCGHGPAPLGDGGGCPDERGRFRCLGCGLRYDAQASGSSYCVDCLDDPRTFHDSETCGGCPTCEPEPEKPCGCWADEVCDECDNDPHEADPPE